MKLKIFLSALCVLLAFAGCNLSPFNPKADIKIMSFTNTSDVAISSLTLTGTPPHTIKAKLQLFNGIDVMYKQYTVDYFDTTGATQYPLEVKAFTSFTMTGTSTSTTTATILNVGAMPINITDANVTAYKTANAIGQMNLVIHLYGEDLNQNQIDTVGYFAIY